jgi:hypothetical protein
MVVVNTVAYYNTATILAVKCFSAGASSVKHYGFVIYGLRTKLVCLFIQVSVFVQTKCHHLSTKSVRFP